MLKIKSSGTPNVLMELSIDAYEYYKCNIIHLTGVTVCGGKTLYDTVHYHNAVDKFIPKYCKGSNTWNEVNLNKMNNNYVLITVENLN